MTGLSAGADHGVRFVDEQDDRGQAALDFINDRAQAAFEFAFDAGTGLQQAEIERAQRDVLEYVRYVALHDAQCQAFHYRRFAHAGLAGQDRIVLSAAQQNVDHLPDFGITSQYRIDLAGARLCSEVDRVFV